MEGKAMSDFIIRPRARQLMVLRKPLINTPLQRGARAGNGNSNRFTGFRNCRPVGWERETAKEVKLSAAHPITPLKRGVDERVALRQGTPPDTQLKLYP